MKTFASLDLLDALKRAVAAEGYESMTPIQARAIPPLLEGRDVLGCAQTGTGKTAAFLLPVLDHLARHPTQGKARIRGLVLTPTRELASQIAERAEAYGQFLSLKTLVMFGGVGQRPQVNALRRGIDLLVATPGRLLDLHGQGFIDFNHVEFFILDEADRMLDMGFIRDIRRVLNLLPSRRQNLLFSATMPDSIVKLASAFLDRPIRVEVDPQSTTVERIVQHVMFVTRPDKKRLLRYLLRDPAMESVIVFTRTKHGANRVAKNLDKAGVPAAAIHGNKSQGARERALAGFKSGDLRVLVATDIASRGIDVDGVSHVVNYDLPNISESYVHRIGRTARAGRDGIAIAFCDDTETEYLRDIQKLTGKALEVDKEHEWHFPDAMPKAPTPRPGQRRRNPPRGGPTPPRGGPPKGGPPRGGPQKGGPPRGGPPRPQGAGGQEEGPPRRKRRRRRRRRPAPGSAPPPRSE